MDGARIVHFEDDPEWRQLVLEAVEGTAHKVVAEAEDLPGALEVLDKMQSGEVEADVVVLGGNLSERRPFFDTAASRDPATIMEGIRERGLKVRTVGLAGFAMSKYGVEDVDADVTKEEAGHQLPEIFDLLEPLPNPDELPHLSDREAAFEAKDAALREKLDIAGWSFVAGADYTAETIAFGISLHPSVHPLTPPDILSHLPITDDDENLVAGYDLYADEETGEVSLDYDGPLDERFEQVVDALVRLVQPEPKTQSTVDEGMVELDESRLLMEAAPGTEVADSDLRAEFLANEVKRIMRERHLSEPAEDEI